MHILKPGMYSQEEIDIMAVNDNKVLLCECKWRNEKVERDVIDTVGKRQTVLAS